MIATLGPIAVHPQTPNTHARARNKTAPVWFQASVEPMQLYEVKLERTEAKERYQESLQRLRTKTTDLKRRKEFQLVDDMARLSRLTQQVRFWVGGGNRR